MAKAKKKNATKAVVLLILVLLFLFSIISYLPRNDAVSRSSEQTEAAHLMNALERNNISSSIIGQTSQPGGLGEGKKIRVKQSDVSVFEFSSSSLAGEKAEQISEDGYTVNNIIYDWIDSPHFFQKDKAIILYVGSDPEVLTVLQAAYGDQFAGGK